MEVEHKEILRKRREAISTDLEPSRVLNRLTVLDEEDRDEIKAEKTRTARVWVLLDMLPRRGSDAFKDFVCALYETKGQEHLAKLLLKDSGIEIPSSSKDEVGMTSQHKQILCRSVDRFHHLDLDKLVPQLSGLLDEEDKQKLLNATKPAIQRVRMLLTEVLPRRGPTAFHSFLQALEKVDPSMAQRLQQEAGMKGSSNDTKPVQETAPYSLATPVHDILEEKPELFKGFRDAMDKDDVLGNGWKRFYKELGLPPGKETAFERSDGGPTLNVINAWISRKGREATVQALLIAANRSDRKDCSYSLEKSLGCQLDCVDSPIQNVTKKMDSLSTEPRELKFFGDLNDSQATAIVSKLGRDAEERLRTVLERALSPSDMRLSTKELILRSETYSIREYTDSLTNSDREQTIKALREALPTSKGVFGPMLPLDKFIRDVGYVFRRNLTRDLSGDDHWKVLAERLGMDHSVIKFLDNRRINPADEVLRHWEVKAHSTVGALYDILVEIECPIIADLL